jgi:8-oxo-dGTP pyrophosphatase MutT (NUDIX family)
MKINTLCDNKWLSLKSIEAPEKHVNGYVFSHETRCNGKIIAILPFRKVNTTIEYLLRSEITPCWSFDFTISSITGGWEGGDPRDTAVLELKEEAGYDVEKSSLISLNTSYGTKSTDTIYYLYSIDLTNVAQGKPTTEDPLEKLSKCVWLHYHDILFSPDPQVSVMYLRLKHYHDIR